MSDLKTTLQYLLESILDSTEGLTITELNDTNLSTLVINAPTETIGQIIGKNGRIIKSIRTLLGIAHPQQRFLVQIDG
jgi:predicted RNA-binding protein YlqC (UPF0109 family)